MFLNEVIEREKAYCISLGIDANTVNEEFQSSFSSMSEIALLRESLINRYAATIRENRFERLSKKPEEKQDIPKRKTLTFLDRMIRNKKNILRDFGISMRTINEEFNNHDIQTVRQLDIIGDEMLSKHFLLMEIKDKVNSFI